MIYSKSDNDSGLDMEFLYNLANCNIFVLERAVGPGVLQTFQHLYCK